jgi:RHS repeat-associated protein
MTNSFQRKLIAAVLSLSLLFTYSTAPALGAETPYQYDDSSFAAIAVEGDESTIAEISDEKYPDEDSFSAESDVSEIALTTAAEPFLEASEIAALEDAESTELKALLPFAENEPANDPPEGDGIRGAGWTLSESDLPLHDGARLAYDQVGDYYLALTQSASGWLYDSLYRTPASQDIGDVSWEYVTEVESDAPTGSAGSGNHGILYSANQISAAAGGYLLPFVYKNEAPSDEWEVYNVFDFRIVAKIRQLTGVDISAYVANIVISYINEYSSYIPSYLLTYLTYNNVVKILKDGAVPSVVPSQYRDLIDTYLHSAFYYMFVERHLPDMLYEQWDFYGEFGNYHVLASTKDNRIAYSQNLTNWFTKTIPLMRLGQKDYSVFAVGGDKFLCMAPGTNGARFTSDFITWETVEFPKETSLSSFVNPLHTSQDWSAATFGDMGFMAVADGSDYFLHSIDGLNWSAGYLPAVSDWRGLTYNENTNTYFALSSEWAAETSRTPEHAADFLHLGKNAVGYIGNFSRSFTDMSIAVPGFTLDFTRTYNSQDRRPECMLGTGWTFGLEGYAEVSGNTVVVYLPDGSGQSFTAGAYGGYTARDSHSRLTKESSRFVLETIDHYRYGFDDGNYLVWMQDPDGNRISINVDSSGYINSVTDTAGNLYSMVYATSNKHKRLSEITDYNNRSVVYAYDTSGRLTSVTDPAGNKAAYSYTTSSYLSSYKNFDGKTVEKIEYTAPKDGSLPKVSKLTSYVTDSINNVSTYTYDRLKYSPRLTVADAQGRETVTVFSADLLPLIETDAEGKSAYTTYDLQYSDILTHTDRAGNKTEYRRNQDGRVTRIINPDRSEKIYTYDNRGNLVSEKDEEGRATYYSYDSYNHLIRKVQPLDGTSEYGGGDSSAFAITWYDYYEPWESGGHPVNWLLKSVVDPLGQVTGYEYNSRGDITHVIQPDGSQIERFYNPLGWMTAEISPSGIRTEYDYDKNGREIRKIVKGTGGAPDAVTRTVYDGQGNVKRKVLPNQYESAKDNKSTGAYKGTGGYVYTYNNKGQILTETEPAGGKLTYVYDKYGNISTETRKNGTKYTYQYDVLNRPTAKVHDKKTLERWHYGLANKTEQRDHARAMDGNNEIKTYRTYDYAGRLLALRDGGGVLERYVYLRNGLLSAKEDALGYITLYAYDGLGQQTAEWTPWEADSGETLYQYHGFVYDKNGNVLTEKWGLETVPAQFTPEATDCYTVNYAYDEMGRKIEQTDSDGARMVLAYNADGLLIKEEKYTAPDEPIITEYEYNRLGLLAKKTVWMREWDIYGQPLTPAPPPEPGEVHIPELLPMNLGSLIPLTTSYEYDLSGNVIKETDPLGHITSYAYDKSDRLIQITEGSGIVTKTAYNGEGWVTSVTNPLGNVTKMEYDAYGNLAKMTDPLSNVTQYAYDLAGRKTAEITPVNYKTSGAVNRIEFRYDDRDNIVKKTRVTVNGKNTESIDILTNLWDRKGRLIQSVDALGGQTLMTYDLAGNLLQSVDPEEAVTEYVYDALGRKLAYTDANGAETEYEYSGAGSLEKVTTAGVTTEENSYDLSGRLLTRTDGNGTATKYEYNNLNKPRFIILPGDESIPKNIIAHKYDKNGSLIETVDSDNTYVLNSYDEMGRLLNRAEGLKTNGTYSQIITNSFTYDKTGAVLTETDGNGNKAVYTYDKVGRVLTVTNPLNQKTTRTWDKNGNLLTEKNWRGNTWTNVYDPWDRLIQTKNQDGVIWETKTYNENSWEISSADALGNVTQYGYDQNGRIISVTDPLRYTVESEYDGAGNLIAKTDENGNRTEYAYDEFNRLIAVTDALGIVTSYEYDNNGNRVSQTDGMSNAEIYEYNARNLLSKSEDANGITEELEYNAGGLLTRQSGVSFTYDSHGRELEKTADGVSISKTWDNNGNLLTLTDAAGTTTNAYDGMNRLTATNTPGFGQTTFQYDITSGQSSGFIGEKTTDPVGNAVTRSYDKTERLAKITISGVPTASASTSFAYNKDGSKQKITYPNNMTEEYSYNARRELVRLVNYRAAKSALESFEYAYDAHGNLISKLDARGQTVYEYDELNRLSQVIEPGGRVTDYAFDGANNRAAMTVTEGGAVRETYYDNRANQLVWQEEIVNGEVLAETEFIYDVRGNQVQVLRRALAAATMMGVSVNGGIDEEAREEEKSATDGVYANQADAYAVSSDTAAPEIMAQFVANMEPLGEQITSRTFDGLDRLTKTVLPDGTVVTNAYNGLDQRTRKTTAGDTINYLYEGSKVILETDGAGQVLAQTVQGDIPVARKVGSTLAYYMYNGHGDITALVSAGNVLATYYYDAFGNILEQSGNFDNSLRYAGYQYDEETGSYYLLSRFYDPVTARFLSRDTYVGEPDDPLSLNRYAYCHNEPLRYIDSDGHIALLLPAALGAVALITKGIDYGLTAWDVYQSTKVLTDSNASAEDRVLAAVNIGLAAVTEALEPDDLLPVGIPADDAARKLTMNQIEKIVKEEGLDGLRDRAKEFGAAGETITKKIDEITGSKPKSASGVGDNAVNSSAGNAGAGSGVSGSGSGASGGSGSSGSAGGNGRGGGRDGGDGPDGSGNGGNGSGAGTGERVAEGAGKRLTNGAKMTTNEALDAADDFLGPGYKEVAPGVYRSKDGLRQVRMTDADISGAHGGGAHMNFETGHSITNPGGRVTFKATDNMHIYLAD